MTPEPPENLPQIVRSQIRDWAAELEILRHDPKVRDFLFLLEKIDRTDALLVKAFAPRDGGTNANGAKLGFPSNELSALKTEDLEDVIVEPLWSEQRADSPGAIDDRQQE